MKKIGVGILLTVTTLLIYRSCTENNEKKALLKESSMLIQQRIDNVSKLIVSEGHFSEVYTYKDSQELFGKLITADKKALVVVNAEVTIAYDLGQIDFDIDETTKTLRIRNIPEPETKINPDFEYYDVSADYLNPFGAEDYNVIKENVGASLKKKIETSSLRKNAKDRLIMELSKYYVLTSSLGWTLVYRDQEVVEGFENLMNN